MSAGPSGFGVDRTTLAIPTGADITFDGTTGAVTIGD